MPDRPPAAVRWVALAAPTSADGERRIHPTQVVALQVAVHDVVAWRQAQDQGPAVVDVEALGLAGMVEAGRVLVDRESVALQRQLVRGTVGSYDVELVGGRALIEDEEADGAGWHDGNVPPDMEIVESHVHGGAQRRGLVPALHGEEDHERERRRHERECPRPATPRPSPRHPVPLGKMTRRFYPSSARRAANRSRSFCSSCASPATVMVRMTRVFARTPP